MGLQGRRTEYTTVATLSKPAAADKTAWYTELNHWCKVWGVPALGQGLSIEINNRLRVTLGQYKHKEQRIEIAEFILGEKNEVILEVLCHEAAHAAAAKLFTKSIAPHGPEWRNLIEAAGFSPTNEFRRSLLGSKTYSRPNRRTVWEHRCAVCHTHRRARRPVKEWRCATCREAGLEGKLDISKLDSSKGV
jgi:predicted SprT family Zn-dependent metalloprotease